MTLATFPAASEHVRLGIRMLSSSAFLLFDLQGMLSLVPVGSGMYALTKETLEALKTVRPPNGFFSP